MSKNIDALRVETKAAVYGAIFRSEALEETEKIMLVDDGDEAMDLIKKYPAAEDEIEDEIEMPGDDDWPSDKSSWDWWHGLNITERQMVRGSLLYAWSLKAMVSWSTTAPFPDDFDRYDMQRLHSEIAADVTLYDLVVHQVTECVRLDRGVDGVAGVKDNKGRHLPVLCVTKLLRGEIDEAGLSNMLTGAINGDLTWWAHRYRNHRKDALKRRQAA